MNQGTNNGMNKGMTRELAETVYTEGTTTAISIDELAKKHNSTFATVQQILNRKNWRWLTNDLVRECSTEGCTRVARYSGKCRQHKPRVSNKVYKKCIASWEGGECDRLIAPNRKDYCSAHYIAVWKKRPLEPIRPSTRKKKTKEHSQATSA